MHNIEYTDPARELVDTCRMLHVATGSRGDELLATSFGVVVWSREFYEIVMNILERIEALRTIVDGLAIDEDVKEDAKQNLDAVSRVFSISSLCNAWNSGGLGASLVNRENLQPILMLSGQIRALMKYPKISDDLAAELLSDTTELLQWLEEHQIGEEDFIRQAIIDGIKKFQFRVSKLKWLGYGYTIESLKEVISAYIMLERAVPDLLLSPNADAALRKFKSYLSATYTKLGQAKDAVEIGEFMLVRAYAVFTIAKEIPSISGLLPSY